MTLTVGIALVIALMLALANLPFFTERVLGVITWTRNGGLKPFWMRLLELALGYAVAMGVGFALEARMGNRFPQGWEFYAITATVFLVCAYPGFVWRYLRRGRPRAGGPRTGRSAAGESQATDLPAEA